MKEYYAAESTSNPIWLAQRKERMGIWETITVFHSREAGELWLSSMVHHYGELGKSCRVYSVPLRDELLAQKMAEIRSF